MWELIQYQVNPNWSKFTHDRAQDGVRNHFQRDRDRILYSSAFRRLAGKTQIFFSGLHDHIRTRLTHTLEVAQIARTICRDLGLNEDLAEAIALGHDLGHTPFGHVGEDVLKLITANCDNLNNKLPSWTFPTERRGFKHNLQSLRVVCETEGRYHEHPGLNLSSFVRWGILSHSKMRWKTTCNTIRRCRYNDLKKCPIEAPVRENRFSLDFYEQYRNSIHAPYVSLESVIVGYADEIAQRHHDLEDGIYAGIISKAGACDIVSKLPGTEKYKKCIKDLKRNANNEKFLIFVGILTSQVVDLLIRKLIEGTVEKTKEILEGKGITSSTEYRHFITEENQNTLRSIINQCVQFPDDFKTPEKKLHDTLKNRILKSFIVERMDGKGRFILRQIWKAYLSNPQQLPDTLILDIVKAVDIPKFNRVSNRKLDRAEKVGRSRAALSNITVEEQYRKVHTQLARMVCDYISGMTDEMAMEEHRRLYSPHEEVRELR